MAKLNKISEVLFASIKDAEFFKKEFYKHYKRSFYKRFAKRIGRKIITNATRNQIRWMLTHYKFSK